MTTHGSRDICAIFFDKNDSRPSLYRSVDLGDNWVRIDGAIGSYWLISPAYTPSGDLYVATDEGIFRASALAGVRVAAGPQAQALWLGQNSPNPIWDITTIPFRLPISGHVTLRVHDMLGRVIATLLDKEMPAGPGEARFDSRNLESGTYLVELDGAGDHTSQIIVVRH
jgi:hypothetical protein